MGKPIANTIFRWGILQKLLAGLCFVLALWTMLLVRGAVGVVEYIGEVAANKSEAGIRSQALAMFNSLVEEKARRQDEVFRQAAEHTQLIARMAGTYLERKAFYGKSDVFHSNGLERCPVNGLYSNSADELTNIVYCCQEKPPAAFTAINNVYSHLDPLLERIQKANPTYLAVWAAYEFAWHSGFAHYYPNIHYIESIPRPEVSTSWESVYYQAVCPENDPQRETRWTKALNDDTGVGLIVSVITPVTNYKGNQPFTAAALDISLKTLVDEILCFEFHPGGGAGQGQDELSSPSNAFAFLVDREDSIIAFPEKQLSRFGMKSIANATPGSGKALDMNLADSSLPGMTELVRSMDAQAKGTTTLVAGGETYDVFFHRIETTGWTYGIVVPGSELFTAAIRTRGAISATVSRLTHWLGYGSAGFLSLTLLFAMYYLRRRMVSPLRTLVGAMRRASDGDLGQRVESGTDQDEMTDLAHSFNAMTSGLQTRQDALHQAESKYRDIFESAVEGMFQCAPDGRLITANPAFAVLFGCATPEEVLSLGDFLATCSAIPDDRKRFHAQLARDGVVVGFDTLLRRRDGRVIWGSVSARAVRNADNVVEVLDGSLLDITERRRAAEQAAALNRNLLNAQEEKRADMSRDLHDDLAQNLSSLKIDSDHLAQDSPDKPEIQERLQEFARKLNRTVDSICDLVYGFYPADLEEKGLAEALRRHLHDFTTEHGIAVQFVSAPDLPLSSFSALARIMLYRIVQEALHNVRRHAGSTSVLVEMAAQDSRLVLRVADDGQGFDQEQTMRNALAEKRMGLAGMRERAYILGGEMQVVSMPGRGTEIVVTVPITSATQEKETAGAPGRPS